MVNEYWKKRIKAEQLAKIERDASLGDEFKTSVQLSLQRN